MFMLNTSLTGAQFVCVGVCILFCVVRFGTFAPAYLQYHLGYFEYASYTIRISDGGETFNYLVPEFGGMGGGGRGRVRR